MGCCSHCKTEFKFSDVLKGFNPARIQCSGCQEKIKSSYLILVPAVIVFAIFTLLIWFYPFSGSAGGGLINLGLLAVLGLVFEYAYFFLLNNGIIQSNLSFSGDS